MNHKGFSNIAIAIILLAILAGLSGGYLFLSKKPARQEISQQQPSPITSWKVYKNVKYKYQISYPEDKYVLYAGNVDSDYVSFISREDWERELKCRKQEEQGLFEPECIEGAGYDGIEINVKKNQNNLSLDEWINKIYCGECVLHVYEPMLFKGFPARKVFIGGIGLEPDIVFLKDDNVFIITAPWDKITEAMVESFQFIY